MLSARKPSRYGFSTASHYLRKRERTTTRVPARSDIPATARLRSTSGAGAGVQALERSDPHVPACAALLAPKATTADKNTHFTIFLIFPAPDSELLVAFSTASGYLRKRERTTTRVPPRSEIPARARLGSTSGAGLPCGGPCCGGGGGGGGFGGPPWPAKATVLAPRATTKVKTANFR
jgi:hypothetical protein